MRKTLYDVLNIKSNASEEEIKKALREKARQCHPDHHPNDAAKEDEFKAVSAAYKVLSDPRARRQYDATGEMPSGNDITAKAYELIIIIFKQLRDSEGDDIFFKDPIDLMQKHFKRARQEIRTKICQVRKQNKRLEKIGLKLKHKGQGGSFLHSALMEERQQNKAMIQNGRVEVAITKKALKLVENYSFETEPAPYVETPVEFLGQWTVHINR